MRRPARGWPKRRARRSIGLGGCGLHAAAAAAIAATLGGQPGGGGKPETEWSTLLRLCAPDAPLLALAFGSLSAAAIGEALLPALQGAALNAALAIEPSAGGLRLALTRLGAVGVLQFDVVQARLRDEYRVNSKFEGASIHTVRWIDGPERELQKLIDKSPERLARDHSGALVYLANSRVNLDMTIERWPELRFTATREQSF